MPDLLLAKELLTGILGASEFDVETKAEETNTLRFATRIKRSQL